MEFTIYNLRGDIDTINVRTILIVFLLRILNTVSNLRGVHITLKCVVKDIDLKTLTLTTDIISFR